MRRRLAQHGLPFAVIVTWLAMVGLMCCGPSAQQRAMSTSLASLNAARAGFDKFDEQHQEEIVLKYAGRSKEEVQGAITEYRTKYRDPISKAFLIAYTALSAASAAKTDQKIQEAAQAVVLVLGLVEDLTHLSSVSSDPPASQPTSSHGGTP